MLSQAIRIAPDSHNLSTNFETLFLPRFLPPICQSASHCHVYCRGTSSLTRRSMIQYCHFQNLSWLPLFFNVWDLLHQTTCLPFKPISVMELGSLIRSCCLLDADWAEEKTLLSSQHLRWTIAFKQKPPFGLRLKLVCASHLEAQILTLFQISWHLGISILESLFLMKTFDTLKGKVDR